MQSSNHNYQKVLDQIAFLIHKKSGIFFPPNHMKVLDQRVKSSMKKVSCTDEELLHFLSSDEEKLTAFIGYVTTNHTHFFRSIHQFHSLGSTILPELIEKNQITKHIKIWSTACSSGEEPYSLAIYIQHYFNKNYINDWSFTILATDIDKTSLKIAKDGIYFYRALKNIPKEYHKYIDINPGTVNQNGILEHDRISMTDDLKKHITFSSHNLLEPSTQRDMDIIFCRNVLIYFDVDTQQQVILNLSKALAPNRYFFVSPSETLTGISTNLHIRMLEKSMFYVNDLD